MNKLKSLVKKVVTWIKNEKINAFIFAGGTIIFIELLIMASVILFRGGGVDNTVTVEKETTTVVTAETESKKDESVTEEYTTIVTVLDNPNYITTGKIFKVSAKLISKRVEGSQKYSEYMITLKNITSSDIDGFAIALRMDNYFSVEDCKDMQYNEEDKNLILMPYNDNKKIKAGESFSTTFIVSSGYYVGFSSYTAFQGKNSESLKITYQVELNNTEYTTKKETTEEETTKNLNAETTKKPISETTKPVETTKATTAAKETTAKETTAAKDTTGSGETTTLTNETTTKNTETTAAEATTVPIN
jgi:hypothetical protein